MAVSNMPYRGRPLTMLADPAEHKLYTTIRIESRWDQVVLQPWQEEFSFTSDQPVFWLVIASGRDHTLLAASNVTATGKLIEWRTGRVLLEISIPAGGLTRRQLLREGAHLRSLPTEPNGTIHIPGTTPMAGNKFRSPPAAGRFLSLSALGGPS
jgi:hypothetical protein